MAKSTDEEIIKYICSYLPNKFWRKNKLERILNDNR